MYICGCVKNCGKALDRVFNNIEELIKNVESYKIIIAYDDSEDNSLTKLNEWKDKLQHMYIIMNNNHSKMRTENIANARNSIIEFICKDGAQFEYFIMMDMDSICAPKIKMNLLLPYLHRNDWDSLSFNRSSYYDIWALSFEPYKCSVFQFDHTPSKGNEVVKIMRSELVEKLQQLKDDELLEVYSAFNGFAIYRTEKFIDCRYSHLISDNYKFISREKYNEIIDMLNTSGKMSKDIHWNNRPTDCEHRHFHLEAIQKHDAKIRISPLILF